MITTLGRLAEQIILLESGGTKSRDSELLDDDVIYHIRQVAAALLKVEYFDGIKSEEFHDVPHHYIYPYTVTVQKDAVRDQSYIVLPDVPSSLPGNKGLRAVVTKKNPYDPIPIISEGQMAMIRLNMGKDIVCYPEGKNVYFNQRLDKHSISEVIVKIVTAVPESLGVDEQVYMPYDMQARVIEEVRKRIQPKPQDIANDNAPVV